MFVRSKKYKELESKNTALEEEIVFLNEHIEAYQKQIDISLKELDNKERELDLTKRTLSKFFTYDDIMDILNPRYDDCNYKIEEIKGLDSVYGNIYWAKKEEIEKIMELVFEAYNKKPEHLQTPEEELNKAKIIQTIKDALGEYV